MTGFLITEAETHRILLCVELVALRATIQVSSITFLDVTFDKLSAKKGFGCCIEYIDTLKCEYLLFVSKSSPAILWLYMATE